MLSNRPERSRLELAICGAQVVGIRPMLTAGATLTSFMNQIVVDQILDRDHLALNRHRRHRIDRGTPTDTDAICNSAPT